MRNTLIGVILIGLSFTACNSNNDSYMNPNLPVEERVSNLKVRLKVFIQDYTLQM